jgi:hypothetical protein
MRNLASIPVGTKALVGAPAVAIPNENLERLMRGLGGVRGLAEVHLPLVLTTALGPKPQLLLAVLPTGEVPLHELEPAIAAVLASDPWSSSLPITFVADSVLMHSIQAAAVQVVPRVSSEWSTRVTQRDSSFRRMALAVIVSLLVLLAWQLTNR